MDLWRLRFAGARHNNNNNNIYLAQEYVYIYSHTVGKNTNSIRYVGTTYYVLTRPTIVAPRWKFVFYFILNVYNEEKQFYYYCPPMLLHLCFCTSTANKNEAKYYVCRVPSDYLLDALKIFPLK